MTVAASDDIAMIDRVLASWAAWARDAGMPLCSHSSLRYSSGRDSLPSTLRLSDDKFARVDRAVAHLHTDSRAIIHVHYCRHENESKRRKAERCSMSLRHYQSALTQAQLDVLESLQPDVYAWQ
jgi:hypothetical protein